MAGPSLSSTQSVLPPPPETIEDAPITVDTASELMGRFGFVAFRTPPGEPMPDSCLMAIFRDAPTLQHFDPEFMTYWVFENGHGRLDTIDRTARSSVTRPFSWGRIRIVDRLGKRNSFVTFGGQLTTVAVGRDALLVICRSPAPILRLAGHSQFGDRLGEEVLAFFSRVVPCLWDSTEIEGLMGRASPDALYAAFLLHERARTMSASEAISDDRVEVRRATSMLARERPIALTDGERLLKALSLDAPRSTSRHSRMTRTI